MCLIFQERETLYNGCNITREESELLILNYNIRRSLTDLALEDLLDLINCHLPTPLYKSKYTFLKQFESQISIETHYYCPQCQSPLTVANAINQCELCNYEYNANDFKNNYFLTIPLKKQLESIVNGKLFNQFLKSSNHNSDVINGEVYKTLREREIISTNDISIQFNTDGVSLFKSSGVSIWPIQVMINELPFKIRKEKIILCGLWYGSEKPNMNLFLSPFTQELIDLHTQGIVRSKPGSPDIIIKVHTLMCTVDSVARPLCQMIIQYNGKYGCSFCLHEGDRIEVGRGYARVYPGSVHRIRTLEQHEADAREASVDVPINGVKGMSILMFIPLFNIIHSFIPDYMHCVLLGVIKTLICATFDSTQKDKMFYLGRHIREIDERLLNIKPPCEVSRVPRSIGDRALWKANEWRNFILYYFLPCFKGILPLVYLKHWLLLVTSLHLLLRNKITSDDLQFATKALKKFVSSIPELYGMENAKFNMHLLLHIPSAVKKFGALWATSTFPYEKYNGILKKIFKNTQAPPEQICKSYRRLSITQELSSIVFSKNDCPEDIKQLYKKLVDYLKIKRCVEVGPYLRLFGAPKVISLTLAEKTLIEQFLNVYVENTAILYERFIYKNTLYHANIYTRLDKRNNSIVRLADNIFIEITKIITISILNIAEEKTIIIGQLFEILPDLEVCSDDDFGISSSIFSYIAIKTNRMIAISPHMLIDKCLKIELNEYFNCLIPLVNKIEED